MEPSYFDVHTHLNLDAFKGREDEEIKESLEAGVWMINAGADLETSLKAVELADSYESGVYATAGIHPGGKYGSEFNESDLMDLILSEKVVAVGECGLDYFHITDEEGVRKQREPFLRQIDMANRAKKPLMLHLRNGPGGNAYRDAISMLKEARFGGNAHFFSGSRDDAKELLSLGFTLSFTGVVTFTDSYDDLVRFPPLDMVMSETDAPYVAPLSVRGKENRPVYVKEIAQRIAEIRPEEDEMVLSALVENARRVFGV